MLQEASTHLIVLEPSEDLIASEPWAIESYADGLMNEIFADIDQILEKSGNLLPQILQQRGTHTRIATAERLSNSSHTPLRHQESMGGEPAYSTGTLTEETDPREWFQKLEVEPTALPLEYVPLQTVGMPQIVLPETLIQHVHSVPQVRNQQLSKVLVDTPGVHKVSKPRQKWRRTLSKLLSVGVTLGFIITAIVWALHSRLLNRLTTKSFQQALLEPQPKLPTTAKVEADIVDYILGALAAIDRQEANNQKSAKTLLATAGLANQTAFAYMSYRPTGNLPPLPVAANNTPSTPSPSTTVVERLYIPVYQAPSPMRYAPPPILGNLSPLSRWALPPKNIAPNTSLPAPVKTVLNTVPTSAKPVAVSAPGTVRPEIKPVAIRNTPITIGQPPKPLPVLPVVSSRITQSKRPTAKTTEPPLDGREMVAVSVPAIPTPSHILEGLLELGHKSAALFKIDGITRRVDIGESIGSSGWTLVDVANGEAVIRRNGEVRSVYTGQKF